MEHMALSTSVQRHPDGSRRWAEGRREEQAGGRGGGRREKAGEGRQERASGTRLPNQSPQLWV